MVSWILCIVIGGSINAYRLYAISAHADNKLAVHRKSAMGGFVSGAICYGIPLGGVVWVLRQVADTWALWSVILMLAFGIGLFVWESLTIARSKRLFGEVGYRSDLPLVFRARLFKLCKIVGVCGILIIPAVSWRHGLLWAAGADVAFILLGNVVGVLIYQLLDAPAF